MTNDKWLYKHDNKVSYKHVLKRGDRLIWLRILCGFSGFFQSLQANLVIVGT
jgi:hypothetical protein